MRRSSEYCGAMFVAGTIALLAGGTPAYADDPPSTDDTAVLHSEPSDENHGVGILSEPLVSPAGCYGHTDYAHKSTKYASVHGRTNCDVPVPTLGVLTHIQKEGWLYWETMEDDQSEKQNSARSEDAHPHWICTGWGEQTYRGMSVHWSIEGGTRYSRTTYGEKQRFSC